jgi:hypothetical protein
MTADQQNHPPPRDLRNDHQMAGLSLLNDER